MLAGCFFYGCNREKYSVYGSCESFENVEEVLAAFCLTVEYYDRASFFDCSELVNSSTITIRTFDRKCSAQGKVENASGIYFKPYEIYLCGSDCDAVYTSLGHELLHHLKYHFDGDADAAHGDILFYEIGSHVRAIHEHFTKK